jgi:pilus assembly protein CpaE
VSKLSFVIYTDQEECGAALARLVQETDRASSVEVISDDENELAKVLEETRPDVLFADLGRAPHVLLDALERLGVRGQALFVAGPQEDSSLLLRALKLGAREYFPPLPEVDDLGAALDKLMAARSSATSPKAAAPIIAVMGAKGGVGATVVACQLAASLQRLGGQTVLVDLNFPLGDVALQLDLRPPYTLASVVSQADACDATFLRTLLQRHPTGLHVLAAPDRVEEAELVRGEHVEKVLPVLQGEMDWVVLDVSRSWNEACVRALDLASQIVLVTALDVAALNHTRQHLDLLRRLGHEDSRIHLVANRYSTSEAVTDKEFEEFIGRPFDFHLPNDYATAVESVNSGRAICDVATGSELANAFGRLATRAHTWCGVDTPDEDADDPKLTRRLRRIFQR